MINNTGIPLNEEFGGCQVGFSNRVFKTEVVIRNIDHLFISAREGGCAHFLPNARPAAIRYMSYKCLKHTRPHGLQR